MKSLSSHPEMEPFDLEMLQAHEKHSIEHCCLMILELTGCDRETLYRCKRPGCGEDHNVAEWIEEIIGNSIAAHTSHFIANHQLTLARKLDEKVN